VRIHHLNCGSLHPKLVRVDSITYCLLIETAAGLALVDTGFGTADYRDPSPMMKLFMLWMGVPRRMEETAVCQVQALGYSAGDVRDIALTHLHLDHAGGLRDFPDAQVHVYRTEYEAREHPVGLMERFYDARHWAHGPHWVVYDEPDGNWYGFESLRVKTELPLDVRLIPLPGHTRGHCGVAVATDDGWLLQCGDAASCQHPATDIHALEHGRDIWALVPARLTRRLAGPHVPRLRALLSQHRDEIEAISGHDVYSFRRHQRAARAAAGAASP
jgi:glyoxylase-like metal-dependent hydrolase (beta-lactamase superfamily II)